MNDKEIILTMQYEDGTQAQRKLLTIFEAAGKEYAALIVLNDDGSEREGADIELVQAQPYANEDMEEDYILSGITSEAELIEAREAFDRLVSAEGGSDSGLNESSDFLTLSFKNEKGQFEDWKVVDVFDNGGRKYIALIPSSEAQDNENVKIYLMRLKLTVQAGIEGCEVSSIQSDMEYEEVERAFERRVYANA